MEPRDRLGLRTRELWLLPPEAPSDEEADPADGLDLGSFVTVRATCQQSTVKDFFSRSGTCSVRVPAGGTVADLRQVLGENLPEKAKVLAERPGQGPVTLRDSEAVPEEVKLTDFRGNKSYYCRLSRDECYVALLSMRNFFRRPKIQQRLDKLEAAANGNELEYRQELLRILAEEAYPLIGRRLRLPQDEVGPPQMMEALGNAVWSDLPIAELWLEAEFYMRNKQNIGVAQYAVSQLRDRGTDTSG
mmetsp:Transcript_6179/g.19063  ORF Transcript_6179/g.19063 Transcript_6179/m.19063 type:complete len:246 (+) Transcript_6179:329-1066(+)